MELLKEEIQKAGVVGAGGAGFPSAFKLAKNIDTILINAAECEPLLLTDFYLLSTRGENIHKALESLVYRVRASKGVIALKKHTADKLGIKSGSFGDKIEYKVIEDIYPAGDELVLIYEALGVSIPQGSLPISKNIVVYNLETLLKIYKATKGDMVTHKYITVAGDTKNTYLAKVPLGTTAGYVLEQLGIQDISSDYVIIDGGPIMGKIVTKDSVVTKTTKGFIVLPANIVAVKRKLKNIDNQIKQASSACCGCRMCTDLCPRHLLGYNIEPHKIVKTVVNDVADKNTMVGAFNCCDCGICDIVACCQGISPRQVYNKVKSELVKYGVKSEKSDVSPNEYREYRKIPVSKVICKLGLEPYDRDEYKEVDITPPNEVIIKLKQHIGRAYKTTVKVGEIVKLGTPLVENSTALGAMVHSSIDGRVEEITDDYIKIRNGGYAR